MSIFDDIAGAFGKITSIPGQVASAFRHVWDAVRLVWWFLKHTGKIVTDAWDWMVNGVQWFGGQIEGWAGHVYNTIAHLITDLIPNAILWVYRQTIGWAWRQIQRLGSLIWHLIKQTVNWAGHLIHSLIHWLDVQLKHFIGWASGPIRWVLKWANWIIHLLTHPENIVRWILGALVMPLVLFILRSSAPIFGWLFKAWAAHSREAATTIEDILHSLL